MNKIKYIGFHHCYDNRLKMNYGLAGTNKMEYVAKVLSKDLNLNVSLVSPSWYNYEYQTYNGAGNIYYDKIYYPKTVKTKGKILGYLNILYSNIWLTFFLLFKTSKNENILVYHSPWLALPIIISKKLKRFNLILEVEEIYGSVWKMPNFFNYLEKVIIEKADSYILVSEKLGKLLPEKPSVVLYGSYWQLAKKATLVNNNNKIKVVYSGAIDSFLGGVFNLIESAKYLNTDFEIHILGYGSSDELSKLENAIEKNNSLQSTAAIYFHGVKYGDEFNAFLQDCHIGVNAQYEGNHMNSAFPSKILTYLSNNLLVVSTNIASIKESSISQFINFSKDDSAKNIAECIENTSSQINTNHPNVIEKLEDGFIKGIGKLLIKRT